MIYTGTPGNSLRLYTNCRMLPDEMKRNPPDPGFDKFLVQLAALATVACTSANLQALVSEDYGRVKGASE